MRRFLWLWLSFSFIQSISFSQNQATIDSLQSVLKTDISDRQKVDVYNLLAKEYRRSDSSLVARYTNEAIQLAKQIKYSAGVSDAWYFIAWVTMEKGHYSSALEFYKQALEIAQKHHYKKGVANALKGIGIIHRRKGDYADALEVIQQALEIFVQIKDEVGMGSSYNNLGIIYRRQGNYAKALVMYQQSLKLRKKLGDNKGIAGSYNNMAVIYTKQGRYAQALAMHKSSIEAREKTGDQRGLANSYNNLGIIYRKQGNYPRALEMYQRSLKLKEKIADKRGVARSYNNIGAIYDDQNLYAEALKMYQRSLKIKQELGDKRGVANSYYNMGRLYRLQGNYDLSLTMLKQSLKTTQQIGDKSGIAHSYLGLGHWALAQKKAGAAAEYFQKTLAVLQEIGQKDRLAQALTSLGIAYYLQKNYTEAQKYLEQGLQEGQKMGNPYTIRDGAEYLAKTYRTLGQTDKAYQQLELFKQMADSILSEKNIRQLTQLEERFASQKREDSLLAIQNKKEVALNAEIQTQKANRRTAIIGAILLGALLFVLGIFYRSKQRSNLQLNTANQELNLVNQELKNYNEELQIANENVQQANTKISSINQELKEQQEHIVDSINYAQRIQKAILPIEEKMKTTLPPHFILYRPLDIVSGDFYWFEALGDKQIIAAADCTGHGVPGAFMTMLGTQALNNIVVQNKIHSPDQILHHLDRVLHQLLQSETTQVEDGMDVVVCVIDKAEKVLHCAGAIHPLLLVQNGALREIKGDRYSINTYQKGRSMQFTKHTIDISQPTTFYMYSDGYQDQFGGEKGRKFMKTAFQNLLGQIALKPVDEQKQILENRLDDWMNYEGKQTKQIDDILVIGVQIQV
ncbi:hypothetical protein BKI52_06640 [marine bacterium AO1-C]|nr:hypothetical protein BKI52_06640 [marine bacterium AO1-C]